MIFVKKLPACQRLSSLIFECPHVRLACLGKHLLKRQRQTACMGIVGKGISTIGISNKSCYRAASSRAIPCCPSLTLCKNRTSLWHFYCHLPQHLIRAVNNLKETVGLSLTAEQQSIELHPLCPAQRTFLHIVGSQDNRHAQPL